MQMTSNDPLHGKTLKMILEFLVEKYGFEGLGKRIPIKCFTIDPSVSSSLVFLRKTSWAREKVEKLYLGSIPRVAKKQDLGPIRLDF